MAFLQLQHIELGHHMRPRPMTIFFYIQNPPIGSTLTSNLNQTQCHLLPAPMLVLWCLILMSFLSLLFLLLFLIVTFINKRLNSTRESTGKQTATRQKGKHEHKSHQGETLTETKVPPPAMASHFPQLRTIISIGIPRNCGRIDVQYATPSLSFLRISLVEDRFPSKHLAFSSFQMVQITARKDNLHMIVPLAERRLRCKDSKASKTVVGKIQLQSNHLRTWDQTSRAALHLMRR